MTQPLNDQVQRDLSDLDCLVKTYDAFHELLEAGIPIDDDLELRFAVELCARISDVGHEMTIGQLSAGSARVRYHFGLDHGLSF